MTEIRSSVCPEATKTVIHLKFQGQSNVLAEANTSCMLGVITAKLMKSTFSKYTIYNICLSLCVQ